MPSDPLVKQPATVRVYSGGKDLSAPDWQLAGSARLERLSLESGRKPSVAHIALENAPEAATVSPGIGPDGQAGCPLVEPAGFGLFTLVKVTAQPPGGAEEQVFLGVVAAHRYDLGAERFTVEARDYRWLLEKIRVFGRRVYRPSSETYMFLPEALPVFNAGGAADRYKETESLPAFVAPGADAAGRWTRGHVWNYLRYHWNASPPDELISTADWLEWPEAEEDGELGFLFEEDTNCAPELALGGMTLAAAIETLLASAGGLSWTLPPAGNKGRLAVFGTVGAQSGQRQVTLARGTPGGTVLTEAPEVCGGALALDADRSVNRVRALGAPERYDLTLDTVAGTLQPGWSSAHEAAWKALPEAERARQYPDVFTRWQAPDDLDWTEIFSNPDEETALCEERARELGALLLSADAGAVGADGRPLRLRLAAWRSRDNGATWEPPPAGVSASPLAGAVGLALSASARQELVRSPGADPERWSWDGAYAYHLRVTASIVADRRANHLAEKSGTGWPPTEDLLVEPGCRYDARRKAVIPASEGAPVYEGGEPALFGESAPDPVRDDGALLTRAADRRLADRARPAVDGEVLLPGLRADVAPGDYLLALSGGGARPEVPVRSAVRRVEWRVAEQLTAVGVGRA